MASIVVEITQSWNEPYEDEDGILVRDYCSCEGEDHEYDCELEDDEWDE